MIKTHVEENHKQPHFGSISSPRCPCFGVSIHVFLGKISGFQTLLVLTLGASSRLTTSGKVGTSKSIGGSFPGQAGEGTWIQPLS